MGKITEAKVMKNVKESGAKEKQTSKGFGLVSFADHEDALVALRNTNNNPTIFTNDRRPIVEFSIENRKALLARQKRMEKSKEKNPNFKQNKEKRKNKTEEIRNNEEQEGIRKKT